MPSTVADIFAATGVQPDGVLRWGESVPLPVGPRTPRTGIYVVALTNKVDAISGALADAPISPDAVDELMTVRRVELTLDGAPPTREALTERLSAFWFPDEVVLYVGLAGPRDAAPLGGELAKRVAEYYATPLGARGPHAGGWPLKTLACLEELFVHHAYCADVNAAEDAGIGRFAAHVSRDSREALHDPLRVMPFANLEFPKGNRKAHGIRGARAPKGAAKLKSARTRPSSTTGVGSRAPGKAAMPPSLSRTGYGAQPARRVSLSVHRSQDVTANDIAAGQVRIPIGPTKQLLPLERQDVTVLLRGRELTCRWDPRYGERERSGVIRVGRAAATGLLAKGEVLAVSAKDGVITLD